MSYDTPRYRGPAWFEREMKNRDDAVELIKLVAAEFESDPMSVQCFDARVVERVKACAKIAQMNEARLKY